REGDRYAATFTLRNTASRKIVADVAPKLASGAALDPRKVEIDGGQARDLVWNVTAPIDAKELKWDVVAREVDGKAADHLKVAQSVIPAYPVRTYQATIAQLDGVAPLAIPAERPKGAVPGRGGLEVTLRAHLGDGLDGVREYMNFYSYTCLEQNISRAVALQDKAMWDQWMARLPAYLGGDGLLKYFPSDRLQGEDA